MSGSEDNASKKFVVDLERCLKENRLDEALCLFENGKHESVIEESSWDIVPLVSSHLTAENLRENESLVQCCETILHSIADKCSPSEVVLELLEQVEYSEDDAKFNTILRPLGRSLNKLLDKTKAIEWCVSTIRSYVEGLPIPESERQETSEANAAQDINEISNRIKNIYLSIISFLEPLVEEAALGNNSKENVILRDYLASLLVFLLGRPLCYLPEQKLKLSELNHILPERIIMLISRVTGDLLWFLAVVNARSEKIKSKRKISFEEENYNPKSVLFESIENVPNLSYANFYYYVVTTTNLWETVPQVYCPQYILQACAFLVNNLLKKQENVLIAKGLTLMEHLLKKIHRRSLTAEVLELNVYSKLFNTITNVMIYCGSDKERKKALQVFREYIEKFHMQARYFIVLRLYKTSDHSGLISLTTGILKESIIECLQATPPSPYFLSNNLETLLEQACKLPHGSATDLVEISDEVISSLNLLRFLFIRDQNNEIGIWNLVGKLEKEYLKPLREGISLCRAHWKVKIRDLEEQKKTNTKKFDNVEVEKTDTEVTLHVGGEILPPMSLAGKVSFCHQAVNGLDVMESILCRLNECISANAPHQSSQKIVTPE